MGEATPCPTCHPQAPHDGAEWCPTCNGSGEVVPCGECGGSGEVERDYDEYSSMKLRPCSRCNGSGVVAARQDPTPPGY